MIVLFIQEQVIPKILEYGLLGALLIIAFFIIRYLYNKSDTKEDLLRDRIAELQEAHKNELVDMLQQQFASNNSVIEKIQHISVTDKGAIMKHVSDENEKVLVKIDKLK